MRKLALGIGTARLPEGSLFRMRPANASDAAEPQSDAAHAAMHGWAVAKRPQK
jgi:hypothetical protein